MARTFLQAASSSSDATTYTFSSQNIGTAAGDRHIVCFSASRGVGTLAVNSVTIGGVSATQAAENDRTSGGVTNSASLDIAAVPTGTTGDVVVTYSGGMLRAGISLWRLDDLASATPHDFDGSSANAPTCALDIPDDGCAIGGAITAQDTASTSWSGLTENHDTLVLDSGNIVFSGASDDFASAETGRTITATFSAPNLSSGVFASWAFGAGGGGIAIPIAAYHYNHHLGSMAS